MYTNESNMVRILSQKARSVRLFREACAAFRARPNVATRQRRMDRALAALALRAKAQYLAACHAGADFATAHALGEAYQRRHLAWRGNYDATLAL